jgi:GTPase SAR1 family protein
VWSKGPRGRLFAYLKEETKKQLESDADSFLRRKLVIIGDGACGKTSLLSVFTLGYFPTVSGSTLLQ